MADLVCQSERLGPRRVATGGVEAAVPQGHVCVIQWSQSWCLPAHKEHTPILYWAGHWDYWLLQEPQNEITDFYRNKREITRHRSPKITDLTRRLLSKMESLAAFAELNTKHLNLLWAQNTLLAEGPLVGGEHSWISSLQGSRKKWTDKHFKQLDTPIPRSSSCLWFWAILLCSLACSAKLSCKRWKHLQPPFADNKRIVLVWANGQCGYEAICIDSLK